MKNKKKASSGIAAIALLAIAAVLLAGSAVGSTRAALSVYSVNYLGKIEVPTIDVALKENDQTVEGDKKLLAGITDRISVGKTYDEHLSVSNTGEIETYVRVRVYRSWVDAEEKPIRTLSPELIDVHFLTDNGWVIGPESADSEERTVLYYTRPLASGASTPEFADSFSIDRAVLTKVETAEGGAVKYVYSEANLKLEVEVDSVQSSSGKEAIMSAWGRDVTIAADGTLSLNSQRQ